MIALQVKGAYVAPINQQLSTLKLVETGNQTCQAGFSGAGVPNNCHRFTCLNSEIEAGQYGLPVVIAEKYVFEFDVTCQVSYWLLVDLMNSWLGIDQGEDPLAGCQTQLKLAPKRCDAGQGKPEQSDTLHKEEPISRRNRVI